MGQVWNLLREWADSRVAGGLHDSQIARALGVRPQNVHKWKAGAVPGPENLRRIAELIGADYETVLVPAAAADRYHLDVASEVRERHPGLLAEDVAQLVKVLAESRLDPATKEHLLDALKEGYSDAG